MKRPFVKWIARLLGLLVVLALLGGMSKYRDWRTTRNAGEAALSCARTELYASDPGWKAVISEWNAKRAPKDRNSAERALVILQAIPEEDRHWCRISKLTDNIEWNELIHEADLPNLKAKVGGHRATLERFHELIRTEPGSGFTLNENAANPIGEVSGRFETYRGVGDLISYYALLNISEKKPDDAIRNVRALLGAARAIGDDPSLFGQLDRMKLALKAAEFTGRVINTDEPKVGLAELHAELAAELNVEYLAKALPGERLTMDREFEALDLGRVDMSEAESREPKGLNVFSKWGLQWKWYRQHVPAQRATQLDLFSRYSKALKTPFPDRIDELETVRERLDPANRGKEEILLANLSPAIVKVARNEQRTKTMLAYAVVGLACERFRLANGRWPKILAELSPTYLTKIPLDPYSGEPVLMMPVKKGIVIAGYSFEGETEEDRLSPTRLELFDVKHRRQPPKPIFNHHDQPDFDPNANPKP